MRIESTVQIPCGANWRFGNIVTIGRGDILFCVIEEGSTETVRERQVTKETMKPDKAGKFLEEVATG